MIILRFFNSCILLLCFYSCSLEKFWGGQSRPNPTHPYSVLQGSTDDESTVIRVAFHQKLRPDYKIVDSKGNRVSISKLQDFENLSSDIAIDHLFINGLTREKTYFLSIINPIDQTQRGAII